MLLEAQLERMTDVNYELYLENIALVEEVKYLTSLSKVESKKSD
jgi:hypothetical protein